MATLYRRFAPPAADLGLRPVDSVDDPTSYADRDGYRADFLGVDRQVELPGADYWLEKQDVTLRLDRRNEYVLPYRHFSVVMCRSRRLPLFSAVNIDARRQPPAVERSDIWKRDSRIPLDRQVLRECYGENANGFFSRGHMTRRKDPVWGTRSDAVQADADSFHVTNAAPQAQSFNSPVWLGLEDHLLKRTRDDEMKVSVFTGPILAKDDQEMFGVRIPSRFWKIVIFVHEATGALTATGYMASQARQIRDLELLQYVFGEYRGWQVPLRRISSLTELDLSHLLKMDPLSGAGDQFALELATCEDVITL